MQPFASQGWVEYCKLEEEFGDLSRYVMFCFLFFWCAVRPQMNIVVGEAAVDSVQCHGCHASRVRIFRRGSFRNQKQTI